MVLGLFFLPLLSAAAVLLQKLWLSDPPDHTSVHQEVLARRMKNGPSFHRQNGTPGLGLAKCCSRCETWRWLDLYTAAADPKRLS